MRLLDASSYGADMGVLDPVRAEGQPAFRVRLMVDEDRRDCAEVFVAGFKDEVVRRVMPRHLEEAPAVFAELIQPGSNSWIAEAGGGQVVGMALCREGGSPSAMVNWLVLRGHLPFAASVRAWIVSTYLFRVRIDRDALYLDSLVVKDSWQGRGVGEALVQFVCREARRRGYGAVTLNVIDRNERARHLYERLGFCRVRRTRTRLFGPLVGFGAVDHMEKRLF